MILYLFFGYEIVIKNDVVCGLIESYYRLIVCGIYDFNLEGLSYWMGLWNVSFVDFLDEFLIGEVYIKRNWVLGERFYRGKDFGIKKRKIGLGV